MKKMLPLFLIILSCSHYKKVEKSPTETGDVFIMEKQGLKYEVPRSNSPRYFSQRDKNRENFLEEEITKLKTELAELNAKTSPADSSGILEKSNKEKLLRAYEAELLLRQQERAMD